MVKIFQKIYNKYKEKKEKKQGILSNWSYQRFCRFYGINVYPDPEFDIKINRIINLVNNKNYENIKTIAKESNCNYNECILKLKYLKNKRVIDSNYFINSVTDEIKKCSESDLKLINKYYEMVYQKHYKLYEMKKALGESEEDIYNELKYLSDISLLNGINFDSNTHEILYYSLEKKKLAEKFVTLNCPSCGALVDIPKFSQARCSYCNTIVEDTYSK